MATCLESLLQPPPGANISSVLEDVPRVLQEERQGGPMSRVESSSRRLRGGSPPAPASGRIEPPLCLPKAPAPRHWTKTSVLGPLTRGHAPSEGQIVATLRQEEARTESSSPEGRRGARTRSTSNVSLGLPQGPTRGGSLRRHYKKYMAF